MIVTGPHIGGHEVGEVRLASRRLLFGPVVLPRLARCTHIELGVFLVFYFLASATHNLFPEACVSGRAGVVLRVSAGGRWWAGVICRRDSSEK